MEQDNDLKYYVGLDKIQHLLAVYGIEDCEPSGNNHLAIITTSPHTLSKIINVGFASLVKTHHMAYFQEFHDEYEELLEAKKLHSFLKSCLGKEITLKEKKQNTQQGKAEIIPQGITIKSKTLQNKLLSTLEEFLESASEVDVLIAQNIDSLEPSFAQKMGFFAWWIEKHCFAGFDIESLIGHKYDNGGQGRLYSFIFDLFVQANIIQTKEKNEGYKKNGGSDKAKTIRDWINKCFLRITPVQK